MAPERKTDEDETTGGPSTGRGPERTLSLEEAQAVRDLYERGAARDFVPSRGLAPGLMRSMVAAGLMEAQTNVRGGWIVMLTVRGAAQLPNALKVLAAGPAKS